jgi:transcriptional regulator with GAF, ATPase, and Fis domain
VNCEEEFPDENPNPVMRLSSRGELLYANNASKSLLKRWHLVTGQTINGKALNVLHDVAHSRNPVTADFKSGNRIYTVTFTPMADFKYVNVYALDITDKKKVENSLKLALREVNKLRNRLQRENEYLQDEIRCEVGFDGIIGNSNPQSRLLHKIDQVADTDATVLITGETGTGKELIARAIHESSRRKHLPLIKINCAALPHDLIESELFGHERGAFTGALRRKQGRFEIADGGTLFLDEIGDIPLDSQAKLLRALQEQEFERVGGTRTIKVDVRVIAATNRVLTNTIASGEFREDLFYRLNVFPIHSPPLRERSADINILAHHFLHKYRSKIGRIVDTIEPAVMKRLKDYHWPGNVRELENIIERAVILSEGHRLQLDETFDLTPRPLLDQLKTLGEVEREMIQAALEQCDWKIEGPGGAASRLAMAPSTLRERIRKYEMARHQDSSSSAML